MGLLLLSAINTAVGALIGLHYLLARDGEMPKRFTRLNAHGVPWMPLSIAVILPILVVAFAGDLTSLMGLYAIGVVGAIAVNLDHAHSTGLCLCVGSSDSSWHDVSRAVRG